MKEFFKVKDLETVLNYRTKFPRVEIEQVPLLETVGRVLAEDIIADDDLPDFPRAIVDGYAVQGASTFGSSEGNPAYLTVTGSIAMGESPGLTIGPGEAAQIATGGMLPLGADSVVMIEHTEAIDDTTIEVYRSVAPGQNMIAIGEDIKKQARVIKQGQTIRPRRPACWLLWANRRSPFIRNRSSVLFPPETKLYRSMRRQAGGRYAISTRTRFRD